LNGGIYIHIPYCRKACHYCNFHFSTNLKTIDPLVSAIVKEIQEKSKQDILSSVETIYLGGGTPSLLTLQQMTSIFDAIRTSYQISSDAEVTLEANPEDVSKDMLNGWFDLGINRLSVGIQSFLEKDLVRMNRAHSSEQSTQALKLIKESSFSNITADLMFGLVSSNSEDWKGNLKKMLSYDLSHLSVYNLTIEEQTVYAHQAKKEQIALPSEGLQNRQYLIAEQILEDHGYEHYEISNYAKPGYRAAHNTAYWDRKPYIGFGPSAHSYYHESRHWNQANNQSYLTVKQDEDKFTRSEELSKSDIYNELIMLGLRRADGVDEASIRLLGENFWEKHANQTNPLVDSGVLIRHNDRLQLARNLWYISDDFSSSLFID